MLKFVAVLFGMLVSCIVAPILVWHDYQNGDWFLVSLDVAIILMWGDWLWRKFKESNRDW